MASPRMSALSVCCASLVILAACGKEPVAPKAPETGTASSTAPSSAPAPAAPVEPAPTAGSSAAPAGGANDQAMLALAGKSGCLACHAVDKKLVGPAWKDVGAKYRGQGDTEAKLIPKVKNGGQGVWGSVPMPPNTQVKDGDIKTLVDWILTLK